MPTNTLKVSPKKNRCGMSNLLPSFFSSTTDNMAKTAKKRKKTIMPSTMRVILFILCANHCVLPMFFYCKIFFLEVKIITIKLIKYTAKASRVRATEVVKNSSPFDGIKEKIIMISVFEKRNTALE